MTVVTGRHRGGRRAWRARVPGVFVAVLAAASAVGVVTAALQGDGGQTAAIGTLGAAATASGGGVARARRHRGHHRVLTAHPPTMSTTIDEQLQPAVAVAMSTPPVPAGTLLSADDPAAWSVSSPWTPPAGPRTIPSVGPVVAHANGAGLAWPPLTLVRSEPSTSTSTSRSTSRSPEPDEEGIDPMVDTVPHPVVKLFPLAVLEPDRAAGTIDDRVYAAFEAERRHAEMAALASGGKHAATEPADAAAPRNPSYRSRHSA